MKNLMTVETEQFEQDIDIDINILAGNWEDLGLAINEIVEKSVIAAIESADLYEDIVDRALEVSVVLTNDPSIQTLNAEYRGKDKPTNVLSFATLDDEDTIIPPDGPIHIGDIILALETLQREAVDMDKSLQDHMTHLLIHGTLHLLGYDHMNDEDANIMETLEINVLRDFGIENPYNETNITMLDNNNE
jgi:probable rRNA maturation factor